MGDATSAAPDHRRIEADAARPFPCPMLYAERAVRNAWQHIDTPEVLIESVSDCIADAWRDAMWQRALSILPQWPATSIGIASMPRHGPCVYRIFGTHESEPDAGTILLYVGGTVTPRSRVRQHLASGIVPGAEIVALEAAVWSDGIGEIEARAIRWEQPCLNREGADGSAYRQDRSW